MEASFPLASIPNGGRGEKIQSYAGVNPENFNDNVPGKLGPLVQ